MADEEEKEEATDAKEAESSPKKGGKKLLFIGIGIVVLILAIGTPIVIMSMGEKEPETAQADKDAAQAEQALVLEGFDEEDEYEEDEEPLGALFPMDTIVVNLSTGGYLRCQAQVEFQTREIPRRFYSKTVPIRDGILELFARQTKGELLKEKGRAKLKEDMKAYINGVLKREEVRRIYFTQFVIQ